MFRAYIKDCTDLGSKTKALITLKSGTIKEDRMTTANSSFDAYSIPSDVNIGDLLILLNDDGKTLYLGIITAIKDTTISTSQIATIYNGKFIYSIVDSLKTSSPSTYLEEEISKVIGNFSEGKLYGSSYTDTLIAEKLSPITIQYVGSLTSSLPTDKDENDNENYTEKDMVKWIYELYETYGIVFDFSFPIQDWNNNGKVKIWKPNYSALKISDGFECISSITPTSEMQSTNKLVIYASDKTYRDTYVLTTNGIIQSPSSTAGRPNQVNTKIVYSDDEVNDIIGANLSDTLFNHKIEFNVDLSSKLFTFDDLKLDVPLNVFNEDKYYNTIITAKQFSFDENGVISNLKLTCGKVRNSLTNLISLGIVR